MQRKLAVIMAAEIVGFSLLMDSDVMERFLEELARAQAPGTARTTSVQHDAMTTM